MTTQLLSNEKSTKIEVEHVEIGGGFSKFKAKKTCLLNGETTITESNGVTETENLVRVVGIGELPIPRGNIKFSSERFLELIRIYGHPATLDLKDSFIDGVTPLIEMEETLDNSTVTFENLTEKFSINDLIFVDYSEHIVTNLGTKEVYNISLNLEQLMVTETEYHDFENIINKMIEEKRIKVHSKKRERDSIFKTHWGSSLKYVDAKMNFSEEEWKLILDENFKDREDKNYIDKWIVAETLKNHDILKIKENKKTSEEKNEDWEKDNDD